MEDRSNIIKEAINTLKRLHKENAELKAENARLKSCLQEIKEIAMGIMDDDIEESSAYSDAKQIINLITKAEEE